MEKIPYDIDDFEKEKTTPKFNFSLATLQRIHDCLVLCNYHSIQHDYIRWFDYLDIIYREISPLIVKEAEKTKFNKIKDELEEEKNKYIDWIQVNSNLPDWKRPRYTSPLLNKIRDFEIMLRFKLQQSGVYLSFEKVEDAGRSLR